jgi:periplasmic divalent cation tolerance protein
MMSIIIVYITYPDKKTAKEIVSHLLKEKLIACANYFDIKSSYWWKGKVREEDEIVSICKSQPKNWQKIVHEVKNIHPYDVPCITKIDAESNKNYEDWVYMSSSSR